MLCLLAFYFLYADSIRVERLIDRIGDVTYESGEQIDIANAAYAALNDNSKQNVKNYNTLLASTETYNALIIIRDVIDQVTSNGVSLIMQEDIQDAFISYSNLSKESKKLIKSPQILISANDTLDSLIRIDAVIKLISSIRIDKHGWLYEEDVPTLMQAREKFDMLSGAEKSQVTNFPDLLSYEDKIPPSWEAPVLSENDYWANVAPRIVDLLNSHNLFVWGSYSIPPYFRLRVVYGNLNDDGTYSKKIIDSSKMDSLIQEIECELPTILYDYKLNHPTSIFNEPNQSMISIDFWETYVRNSYTGLLDIRPYSCLQIDLLDFYFGEDHPILW